MGVLQAVEGDCGLAVGCTSFAETAGRHQLRTAGNGLLLHLVLESHGGHTEAMPQRATTCGLFIV